jgi:pimeloyl-ACP methyl ester carboxylesterase
MMAGRFATALAALLGVLPRPVGAVDPVACRAAATHPMRYHLALPAGYTHAAGKRWPVLVCVCGADADFAGLAERFRHARGRLPYLLVVPCTFSSTNRIAGGLLDHYRRLYPGEVIRDAGGDGWVPDLTRRLAWDEAGLLAVLDDLEQTFGTERRVYLTGFSAGGLLAYRMIVRYPDRLAAAVTVCPNFNFWNHGYNSGPASAEDRAVPIRLILGERDPLRRARLGGRFYPTSSLALLGVIGVAAGVVCLVWRRRRSRRRAFTPALLGGAVVGLLAAGRWSGNEAQTDFAARLLADLGYTDVQRTKIEGLGHDPAPEYVLTTCEEIRTSSST